MRPDPYQIILRPCITEKATALQQAYRAYVFEVSPKANKLQIREAIEEIYRDKKVKVDSVATLRVKGKSMIDDLIDDGDIVFLEPAQTAHDGEKVAVWLKDRGEVTLKRFYHEGERVRLQPANSTMQPIYTTPDNVEIQGKFITSIRPSD